MPDTDSKKPRRSAPRLRDGVMKRGNTWSYVIRVKDPETGVSKPRWVGGFATEQDAKGCSRQSPRKRAAPTTTCSPPPGVSQSTPTRCRHS
jgi:integrase